TQSTLTSSCETSPVHCAHDSASRTTSGASASSTACKGRRYQQASASIRRTSACGWAGRVGRRALSDGPEPATESSSRVSVERGSIESQSEDDMVHDLPGDRRWRGRRARDRDRRLGVYDRPRRRRAGVRYFLCRELVPVAFRPRSAAALALGRALVGSLALTPMLALSGLRTAGRAVPIACVALPAEQEVPVTLATRTRPQQRAPSTSLAGIWTRAPSRATHAPLAECCRAVPAPASPRRLGGSAPGRQSLGPRRHAASTSCWPRWPRERGSPPRSPAPGTIAIPRFWRIASTRGSHRCACA